MPIDKVEVDEGHHETEGTRQSKIKPVSTVWIRNKDYLIVSHLILRG